MRKTWLTSVLGLLASKGITVTEDEDVGELEKRILISTEADQATAKQLARTAARALKEDLRVIYREPEVEIKPVRADLTDRSYLKRDRPKPGVKNGRRARKGKRR